MAHKPKLKKKITCPKNKDPFEKVGHDHRIKQ